MIFDLIISNPPYLKGIQYKIASAVIKFSKRHVSIHPTGFPKKARIILNGKIKSIEFIDSHKVFNIHSFQKIAIILYENSKKIYIEENEHNFYLESLYDLHYTYSRFEIFRDIKKKVEKYFEINKSIKDIIGRNDNIISTTFGFALVRGSYYDDPNFNTLVRDKFEYHLSNPKYVHNGHNFETQEECKNFYDFLKLKIVRFLLSINKCGLVIDKRNLQHIPLLDYTRTYTNKEIADLIGLTDEEFQWAISQIPNYYPEDF
jgi:hypothetical protein